MKYTLTFIQLIGFCLLVTAQTVQSVFPLKWKAKIGITTYRTNMVFDKDLNQIFIGSNGKDRNDDLDEMDGVYGIDGETGKVKLHLEPKTLGDNDVNGVAIKDNRLYFGSDLHYFYCVDKSNGVELWKKRLPADVESVPVLSDFNGDGTKDVAVNVEGSGIFVLEGMTGDLIWKKDSLGGSGNLSPALVDLNNDGVEDIITGGRGTPITDEIQGWKMAHYGDYYYALDGKTGRTLWLVETGSGIHASPLVIKNEDDIEIHIVSSYGEYMILNEKGKAMFKGGIGIGRFASPILTKQNGHLAMGQSWYGKSDDFGVIHLKEENTFHKNDAKFKTWKKDVPDSLYEIGRVSATAVLANVLDKRSFQFIAPTENGELLITKSTGALLKRLKLPAGAEATAFIEDVDQDGKLEILIACLDGYLYCFDTESHGKAIWGSFRGPFGNGVMK